ncbi:MAG TPA: FAD-binding protein, partial [Candidatus Kryptobacter bacterium]|nr:FAD-binding protein [Candidatus Kryptobacter bacterium]
DKAVHFPFAIDQKGYLKRGLLSPAFIRRARIVAEEPSGHRFEFLPEALMDTLRTGNYRHIFPQLNTMFHEQVHRGNRVLVVTEFDDVEFERYRTREYYGHVFRGKVLADVRKGIRVNPAYHYTLGGIEVDRRMRASREGVYAIGEAAFIFGEDRIIGGEYMATTTLAPLLAQEIKERMEGGD